MADPYTPHCPTPNHGLPAGGNTREVLETWRSLAGAQDKALRALVTEIDSIAAFMSQKTGAVTGALQTLARPGMTGSPASEARLNALVHHLQFQDQANQRLEQVKDTLCFMADTLKELDNQTKNRVPSLNPHPGVDMQWLHTVICRYNLKDVRERFMQSLIAQGLPPNTVEIAGQDQNECDGPADGEIELF